MKCFNCGAELTDDAKFCSYCGTKITPPELPKEESFIDVQESITEKIVGHENEEIEEEFDDEEFDDEEFDDEEFEDEELDDEEFDDEEDDDEEATSPTIPLIFNPDFLKKKAESLTKKVESFSETLNEKAESFSRGFGMESKSSNARRSAPMHTTYTQKRTNPKTGLFIAVGAVALVVIIVAALIIGGFSSNDDSGNRLIANQTFDAITPVVSGDAKLEVGREYAYMTDAWNVYIAKAVSADVLKIEHWDKTTQSDKTMEYSEDLGSFRIGDEANGFSWVDDAHTAFTFIIQDKYNSKIKKPTAVVFTINLSDSNKDKGTDYNEDIASYSYENDDWHIYRAIPLTDTLIKIECWYRTSSGFFSSHRFGWDVGVIDTENTGTDFAWNENRTAFTITMKDPANGSYWKEEKLTSFILENESYKHFSVRAFLGLPLPENNQEGTTNNQQVQKNGFDSATNEIYTLAGYTVEIPKYWKSENKIDGGFQRYSETNGKVAMLQVTAQAETDNSYSVTFDGLLADNDNMIAMIEATAFKDVTDYEIIDTGIIKGILYKGTIVDKNSGLTGYGEWFAFASEKDRTWCTLVLGQTDNTEYTYTDDFMKMIKSIKPVKDVSPETTPANTAGAPDDWTKLLEKHYEEVRNQFEDAGFTNITCVAHEIDYNENNTFEGSVVNIAIGENGEICTFAKGEQWPKDIKIRIDYRVKPAEAKPDTTKIVLPPDNSKLGKDFDFEGSGTIYYINVDGTSNKPSITTWGSATVTDGVAEYLDYLEGLGFSVTITNTSHKEPHSGFHLYETNFKVSNSNVSWTMYLCIQKELYVEYELDIHTN